eukprot:COSAG02_NODE_5721_length_4095_cov_28.793794_2_plen_184_part_00
MYDLYPKNEGSVQRVMRALHDKRAVSLWMVQQLTRTATAVKLVKVRKNANGSFAEDTEKTIVQFNLHSDLKRQAKSLKVDLPIPLSKAYKDIAGDLQPAKDLYKSKDQLVCQLENLQPIHRALPVIKDKPKPGLDPSPRTRYVSGASPSHHITRPLSEHKKKWTAEVREFMQQLEAMVTSSNK